MITRIPQPQFVGPAPSEVLIQEGDIAQRQAQMIATGFQEGMKNYTQQQAVKAEQEKNRIQAEQNQAQQLSEKQKLQASILTNTLDAGMKAAGAGHEGEFFLDNYGQYKQLISLSTGGNKELTDSILEGMSKSIANSLTPAAMARRGFFDINYGGPQQPAPGAIPGTAQAGGPLGGPASVLPSAIPPFGAGQPAQPPFTPGAAPTVATQAPPLTTLGAGLPQPSTLASAAGAGMQKQGVRGEVALTELVKGLPDNPATRTAIGTLQSMANLDPDAVIRPKEKAALNVATNATVKVLKDSPALKDWIAKGGDEQYLNSQAQALQSALQDPKYADFFQKSLTMTDSQAKEYLDYLKQDDKSQQAANDLTEKYASLDLKSAALKVTAANFIVARETATQRLGILKKTATTSDQRLALQKVEDTGKLADSMTAHYVTAVDNLRTSMKGKSDEEITTAIAKAEADSSNVVGQTLLRAAQLSTAYRNALGETDADVASVTAEIKGSRLLGLIQLTPNQEVPVPSLGGVGASPSAPGVTPPTGKPRTAVPTPQQKASAQDLANQAIQ